MLALRKTVLRYRLISWLLVASILILTLFPVHLHYHHTPDTTSASHEHQVHLHILSGTVEETDHDEAHVLKVSPDALTKKLNDGPLSVLLIVLLLTFLTVVVKRAEPRLNATSAPLYRLYYHLIPPLRAPPRH